MPDRLRVLVVDDDEGTRGVLAHVVAALGHDVEVAADGLEAIAAYERRPADLVLTDWFMPGLDGLALAMRVRERCTDGRYVYIVLISAVVDPENQIAAMLGGADDVLPKPISIEALEARVAVAQRVTAAHRRLTAQNRALRTQSQRAMAAALTDALTGARNRRQLDIDLGALCNTPDQSRRSVLAMLDVDKFKAYNDLRGHVAGDKILADVVRAAQRTLRKHDEIYRYGGEEFAVVLRDIDLPEAQAAIERLVRSVRRLAIEHEGSPHGIITLSAGVAAGPASSPANWIARADAALYAAKDAGRNRVELAFHDGH
ncbi:MAG TPA: diguanylate cyclase [Polyangiaceae bacterium]|nr:diguanylate cyclase [Polyangiaceae bacterium]